MVREPTYKSPPYICSPLLSTILIRLSVARMIKGEIPREQICPIIRKSDLILQKDRRREDFFPIRKFTFQAALTAWESTVAIAAPFTPQPKTKINNGSRAILTTAPITIEIMAIRERPWDMIKGFSPNASSTNSVPRR